MKLISIQFFLLLGSLEFGAIAIAAKEVPPAPDYYVLDEPGVLSPKIKEKIQILLIEHDQLTGEQIAVSIFKSLDDEDLVEWTGRVFQGWRIGQRGKDNGVLIAIFWNDRKARIEVGYGLEALLTDAKSKRIIEEDLIPALKENDPDSAIASTVLSILETIGSPLSENGKADQRLGTVKRSPYERRTSLSPPLFLLICGLLILIFVLNQLLKAEAHFTRGGWTRSNPLRRRSGFFGGWPGSSGGGGFGGGFGGFSGGGGRSGGGGASGSW